MMNASKENARKALEQVEKPMHGKSHWDMQMVHDFICAAIRKLPSEAAYKADKKRRRQKIK